MFNPNDWYEGWIWNFGCNGRGAGAASDLIGVSDAFWDEAPLAPIWTALDVKVWFSRVMCIKMHGLEFRNLRFFWQALWPSERPWKKTPPCLTAVLVETKKQSRGHLRHVMICMYPPYWGLLGSKASRNSEHPTITKTVVDIWCKKSQLVPVVPVLPLDTPRITPHEECRKCRGVINLNGILQSCMVWW